MADVPIFLLMASYAEPFTAPAATINGSDLDVTPRRREFSATAGVEYLALWRVETVDVNISSLKLDVRVSDIRGGEHRIPLRGRADVEFLAFGRTIQIVVRNAHLADVGFRFWIAPLTELHYQALVRTAQGQPEQVAF